MGKRHPTVPKSSKTVRSSTSLNAFRRTPAKTAKTLRGDFKRKSPPAAIGERFGLKSGRKSVAERAAERGMSRATFFRAQKRGFAPAKPRGRHLFFDERVERAIAKNVAHAARARRGIDHDQLKDLLVAAIKFVVPGRDFECSEGWIRGFMSRYPSLKYSLTGSTTADRAYGFNRIAVGNWHQTFEKFMARFTADQVFNVDETSMRLNKNYRWVSLCKKWVVLCPRRVRSYYYLLLPLAQQFCVRGEKSPRKVKVDKETHMSITATICASGRTLPLIVVSQGATLGDHNVTTSDDTIFMTRSNGWADEAVWLRWGDMMIADMKACGQTERVVFADGHSDHECLVVIENFIKAGIHLILLPPNCTHMMQPLDVLFFGVVKPRAYAIAHREKKNVTNKTFLHYFKKAMIQDKDGMPVDLPSVVRKAFAASSLWPFSASVFSDSDYAAADDHLGMSASSVLPKLTEAQKDTLVEMLLTPVTAGCAERLAKAAAKAAPLLSGVSAVTGSAYLEQKLSKMDAKEAAENARDLKRFTKLAKRAEVEDMRAATAAPRRRRDSGGPTAPAAATAVTAARHAAAAAAPAPESAGFVSGVVRSFTSLFGF